MLNILVMTLEISAKTWIYTSLVHPSANVTRLWLQFDLQLMLLKQHKLCDVSCPCLTTGHICWILVDD